MVNGARIHTTDQLLSILDQVVAASARGDRSQSSAAEFWTGLLTTPGHPLATQLPDEPLVDWYERGLLGNLDGARALDIGCGSGRNSRWFAEHGATVEGVDLAAPLLDSVRATMPATVTLTASDVLREPLPDGQFDLVYDSGCFHHLAPHRRITYLDRVLPAIRPGGRFGIVTFAADRVEAPTDLDVVLSGDTQGGMAFSADDLRTIFAPLTPLEIRNVVPDREGTFGPDFLNAALFSNA
ncbi:class I SAM-dependent methyltransferase [Kribbella pittospori]|uniref:Class I SAM-dependent methyltransferase n=1 Tax=Kribbella pittospori TaxID=722689 RepID=A0A4R0L1Q3_9ACTN|nr:class I SAM-dependent methyltransferase [Kribbella pittospori]TCC64728.1 class I SAM-dependent methyltransferase [Kribbella pittospori]